MGNIASTNFDNIEADDVSQDIKGFDITLWGSFEDRHTRTLYAIMILADQAF